MERQYRRRNYFIDKGFQANFIIKFCLIMILASLVIGFLILFLSRNFTTVTIENTKVLAKRSSDFIFPIMLQTVIIVNIFAAIAVIILTLLTSHKIAGPLYRIKSEIDLLRKGNLDVNFRIRSKDQLQDLASSLSDLASSLRERFSIFKDKVSQLRSVLEASYDDKIAINNRLRELDDILNQLKM